MGRHDLTTPHPHPQRQRTDDRAGAPDRAPPRLRQPAPNTTTQHSSGVPLPPPAAEHWRTHPLQHRRLTGSLLEIRADKDQNPLTIRINELEIKLAQRLSAQAGLHIFIDNSVIEI